MDWGLIILLILITAFGLFILYAKWRNGQSGARDWYDKKSPYESYLSEHSTDFNVRFQRGQMLKNQERMADAMRQGNTARAKVLRGMVVHGKSVINHFLESLRPKNAQEVSGNSESSSSPKV